MGVIRRNARRHGFTLVELLVVISIIALLISILLPSLKRARENAKAAACGAQVRGITQAALTYATDDPQENGIPVAASHTLAEVENFNGATRFGNYGFGGKSGIGKSGSSSGIDQRRPTYGRQRLMASWHRPLNYTMYKGGLTELPPAILGADEDTNTDLDLFKCPGDTGFKGLHYRDEWGRSAQSRATSSYDYFGTSYAANVFWTGSDSETYIKSNSPYLRPLSRVPAPANTLMYMENVGRYAWRHNDPAKAVFGDGCDFMPCPEYPEGLAGPKWHQSGWKYQASFADGHATTVFMKSYIPVEPYPTNLTGDCAAPVGVCKWIMIRGQGWQLDTLPAARVDSKVRRGGEGRPSADGKDICGNPTTCDG